MENTKRYSQYKFKFYLNASHSIFLGGTYGERHPHTWEISIQILKMRDEFIAFNYLEIEIEAFLEKYQDKNLNDVVPFNTINPTLENICTYFKDKFRDLLNRKGWLLLLIEIGETPTRSYVINLFNEKSDTSVDDGDLQHMEYLNYKKQDEQKAEEIATRVIRNILRNT